MGYRCRRCARENSFYGSSDENARQQERTELSLVDRHCIATATIPVVTESRGFDLGACHYTQISSSGHTQRTGAPRRKNIRERPRCADGWKSREAPPSREARQEAHRRDAPPCASPSSIEYSYARVRSRCSPLRVSQSDDLIETITSCIHASMLVFIVLGASSCHNGQMRCSWGSLVLTACDMTLPAFTAPSQTNQYQLITRAFPRH